MEHPNTARITTQENPGPANQDMFPYQGKQSTPIEVIDLSSGPPSRAETTESPSQRPPHSTFKPIKIHTAKCDVCNKHNKATLQRCVECGWQICSPCWTMRGGNGAHGVTRTFTGSVFCSSDEEELPRKKPARSIGKTGSVDDKGRFPQARLGFGKKQAADYDSDNGKGKGQPAARNEANTIVADGRVYKKRRFKDLSPEAENQMNLLLIAAEEVLKDSDTESDTESDSSPEKYFDNTESPLFVPTPIDRPGPSKTVNSAPGIFSTPIRKLQYPPRIGANALVPITPKLVNSLPSNPSFSGRQHVFRPRPSPWQPPVSAQINMSGTSGNSTEEEQSPPPSRPFRGRTWEL